MLNGRLGVAELRGDPLEARMVRAGDERDAEEHHPAASPVRIEERA